MRGRDQFSDEERRQLSYLGSMLFRPNTPEEEEVQRLLDDLEASREAGPGTLGKEMAEEESDG